ncbi:hypothetical protein [Hyphomonas sp.]|jgi:hypothetical protein|uniref:hypothetical protein n=1 Tax=Hyphomonas sp. TaxID=87 RepID=UPI000C8AB4FC|nr:hypothetical protein [Hyphomonas sp.]MAL42884.1 hypothetical protein [Hyphomonas sp.]|tara:strand:- start:8591 stop:8863 length:273 start_codon:yes stop_codon:yes gene_type:complete
MSKKIEIKKWYNKAVLSIRDYQLLSAISKGGAEIIYEGKVVIKMSPDQCRYALENYAEKKIQKSLYNKDYRLVNIRFDGKETDKRQHELL